MTMDNESDLKTLWSQRAAYYGQAHSDIDELVRVYEGTLPDQFLDFFHDDMNVHVVNMIRLAWDDLSNLAGKEFPLYVDPDNDTAKGKARAEKQEQIGYGYNRAGRMAGGVTMKNLMKILMWWLTGTANAVLMTLPDYDNQTPFFTFRDPRSHYPPVGWSPWNETKAADALFTYQKSLAQLKIEYPDRADELGRSWGSLYSLGTGNQSKASNDDEVFLWVGEYYHKDTWMVATLEDRVVTLVRSDTGDAGHPGVQPVTAMSLYSANATKGRSMFTDQVSIQAAMARMFSQKLDFYDRTLYPLIFTTPLAGKTIKVGPYAVNEFDTIGGISPRLDVVGPSQSVDADQTMSFALGMSRMLNRNPEQMQGAGEADSAKALSKLAEGVQQTIREGIWPAAIETLPSAYANAAKMDVNLWPSVSKMSKGKRKNANFRVTYRPKVDLEGREDDFDVEPGVGLSGYQGTLEILQLVGAELMSEDDALEQGEWAREPQEAKRRIQAMRMEKLIWANLQARAAQPAEQPGSLMPGAMAKLRRMTQEEGMDLFDAVGKLEMAEELFSVAPPAPDPMAALMAGGGPPGGPGGPGGMLPPPDLAAIQGGIA